MKHWFAIPLVLILLVACSPSDGAVSNPPGDDPVNTPAYTPPVHDYLPQEGDRDLERGKVYIDSAQVLILESYPVQIMLSLQGNLPTPCNYLRVNVQPPDAENRVVVEVYSVTDPNMMCIQVLQSFDASIPLGTFPTGHYTVWVNSGQVGEFDS